MCYFITLAVPQRHAAVVGETAPRGLTIYSTANRSLRESLPADHETFLITSGMCSCGLYPAPSAAEQPASREEHLRQAYAGRGWSQAKIDRAVAQSLAHKKQGSPRFVGYRADVVEFVRAIVTQTSVAALLAHFYDAGVEDARIVVGKPLGITPDRLAQAAPDPDQWLWIRWFDGIRNSLLI
jgi:hypothetical protein